MSVNFTYSRRQSTGQRWLDTAIFVVETDPHSPTPYGLLATFTSVVENEGMPVDRSLLVVLEGDKQRMFGDNCLVDLVLQCGLLRYTHTLFV
jgi:hypothetical protein